MAVTNSSGGMTSAVAVLTVDATTTTAVFTGGDAGEGLDLNGTFEIAEYYGADNGSLQIQNATLTNNLSRFGGSAGSNRGRQRAFLWSQPE